MNSPAPRIRLALITDEMEAGGSQRQIVNLARHLDRQRFDVTVVYFVNTSHMLDELHAAGVRTLQVEKRRRFDPHFIGSLVGCLRRERFDVVHCFSFSAELWGCVAALLLGPGRRPKLLSSIRGRYEWYSPLQWRIKRWVTQRSFLAVSNSQAGADYALERMDLAAERCVVIPNGVELPKPDAQASARLRAQFVRDGRSFVLLFVGRLVVHKDVPTLLRGAALAIGQGLAMRLVIAGDGPLRAELEGLARDLGIADSVDFLGERSDVPELLAAGDCLALTSVREGLSNVILEAMHRGLPVIASRAGGNVELIEDDATGVLFDVGDAEGLAAQIRRIAGDAQLRARLGHAAEASVARHYSVSAMAHRFASLYARALGSGRAQLA